jgi:hypothetical protein
MEGIMGYYSSLYKKRRRLDYIQVGVYAMVIVIMVIVMCINIFALFNEGTYTATVVEKERVIKHGDSKYLIFTEDNDGDVRVFENTDIWIRGKFNSSDMYAQIKVGETYTFHVIGYRIPFMSMYENIIAIE